MKDLIIYNTPDGHTSVALYAKDGNIWLNQSQIAELFATSKQTISHHIGNVLSDNVILVFLQSYPIIAEKPNKSVCFSMYGLVKFNWR